MNFIDWKSQAREYLRKGLSPVDANFGGELALSLSESVPCRPLPSPVVTKEFLDMAETVAHANDPDKWALLYRLAFRLNHENKNLLKVSVDTDVRRAQVLVKSVRRDIHKMHAFVRFKRVEVDGAEAFVAWHKPEHPCLPLAAPFFMRRFGDKPWSIFTPDASAHWNLEELRFGEGMPQNEFAHADNFDEVWKTYYRSIFNPARIKIKAMNAEMPSKYWSSMPEAAVIRDLVREAPRRLQAMAEAPKFLAKPPRGVEWNELARAARQCKACPLADHATQTIFGEGALDAEIMIVGEQPGDEEDLQGRNFVGPAGQILNEALARVGLKRERIYITNAVKHFKFESRGKMRLHKRASGQEQHACRPWLEAELAKVKPRVIIALGVTAGTALYGKVVKVQAERGKFQRHSTGARLTMSWHPAAILRSATEVERAERFEQLVDDLNRCLSPFCP